MTAIVTGQTVLLLVITDRGGPETGNSPKMIGCFGFCTLVEVNVITKVLHDFKGQKLWFLPKKIDCKCGTR